MSSLSIHVVFENAHCIAVDKPASWLSVPGRTQDDARPILGRELEKQINASVLPIHRLDAEVTGLIIYAKSKEFHREANVIFEQHTLQKTYQALTAVGPFNKDDTREWKSRLVRGKKRSFEAEYGKPSITKAIVLDKTSEHLHWRLNPITGRPHQLRFELTKHHCPILGDTLYGSKITWPAGGIALRSVKIQWPAEFAEKWHLPLSFEVAGF